MTRASECTGAVRRALLQSMALAGLLIVGCSSAPTRIPVPATEYWSGRLSVIVNSEPPTQFFAGFELNGNAATGRLLLLNPLGNALALLSWTPSEAVLRRANDTEHYASIAQLAEAATGSAIPVTALFDWLQGNAVQVDGWQADLSGLAHGQLRAERTRPLPTVSLRVLLEQG